MEIESIKLKNLRNEEHYQFQMEFNSLVLKAQPATLGIEALHATYTPLMTNEFNALNVMPKNFVTDELADLDAMRDATFGGLAGTVKSACNHFDPLIREAANSLEKIFDFYGNVSRCPYDEETAAITKLTSDLQGPYARYVNRIGIADWVDQLQVQNSNFEGVKEKRVTEDALKTELKMREVRAEVDVAYRNIVKRINALIIVNGENAYSDFVKKLNICIDGYNNLLAQRQGRNEKNNTQTNTNN